MATRARAGAFWACLLAATLAGCADPEAASPAGAVPSDPAATPGAAAPQDGTATVVGRVADDALTPLANATVSVAATREAAHTGPDGSFALTGLRPGVHEVVAAKAGYAAARRVVDLAPGTTTRVDLLLDRLPATLAYNETTVLRAYVSCLATAPGYHNVNTTCGGLSPAAGEFNLSFPDGWAAVLSEVDWEPQGAATNPEFRFTFERRDALPGGGYTARRYADVRSGPPARVALEPNRTDAASGGELATPPEGEAGPLHLAIAKAPLVAAGVDTMAGFTAEQTFTIYHTVFFHAAPAALDEFTALPAS